MLKIFVIYYFISSGTTVKFSYWKLRMKKNCLFRAVKHFSYLKFCPLNFEFLEYLNDAPHTYLIYCICACDLSFCIIICILSISSSEQSVGVWRGDGIRRKLNWKRRSGNFAGLFVSKKLHSIGQLILFLYSGLCFYNFKMQSTKLFPFIFVQNGWLLSLLFFFKRFLFLLMGNKC